MRLTSFSQLIFFALASSVAAGQSIGVTDFVVESDGNNPQFSARVWYPAAGGIEERHGGSRIRPGYMAVSDAESALSGPVPLIVLSHGSGGSAESMTWIAIGLVRSGALVVAADHPASSGGDPERMSILQVWSQPGDVRRLLDQLLASAWGENIDQHKMAVVGFSLGGATSMSLAGARLQFECFPEFCLSHDDGACRAFRRYFEKLDNDFYSRANSNLSDSRLRAAIAIAPGFSEAFTKESLEGMSTPVLMIAGQNDQQLPPQTHIYPMLDWLPSHSAYVEISGAQHFSFLPLCGDGAITVLAETNEEFVCEEVGLKSRAEIHQETLSAIEKFLRINDVL